jgi:hypothetical protein
MVRIKAVMVSQSSLVLLYASPRGSRNLLTFLGENKIVLDGCLILVKLYKIIFFVNGRSCTKPSVNGLVLKFFYYYFK